MIPTEIRLDAAGRRLAIAWSDGSIAGLPASLLRERVRDAASVRAALDRGAVPAATGLTITRVEPVGNYGVRLAFSDGHDRGIFPWTYLADLATAAQQEASHG